MWNAASGNGRTASRLGLSCMGRLYPRWIYPQGGDSGSCLARLDTEDTAPPNRDIITVSTHCSGIDDAFGQANAWNCSTAFALARRDPARRAGTSRLRRSGPTDSSRPLFAVGASSCSTGPVPPARIVDVSNAEDADADLPPGMAWMIDKETYLRLRNEHISRLRGIEPGYLLDPGLRTEAVRQMDRQMAL